jgi:biopolymer transport protein ExbD
MPVHPAGPRLYKSVRFRHLVKKTGSVSGARASNISLNLTPFVDMMTILVTFLLMVFKASGQLLQAQSGLELPLAQSPNALQLAPVMIVTKTEIAFEGQHVASVDEVLRDDSPAFKIDALYERLDAASKKIRQDVAEGNLPKNLKDGCDKVKAGQRPDVGSYCPDGLAILQADKETDARLINKIVNTAKAAGFDNILFAVKNK